MYLGEHSNAQGRKWELSPLKSQWQAEEVQDWKKIIVEMLVFM